MMDTNTICPGTWAHIQVRGGPVKNPVLILTNEPEGTTVTAMLVDQNLKHIIWYDCNGAGSYLDVPIDSGWWVQKKVTGFTPLSLENLPSDRNYEAVVEKAMEIRKGFFENNSSAAPFFFTPPIHFPQKVVALR